MEMSSWAPGRPGAWSRPCSAIMVELATVRPVIVWAGKAAPWVGGSAGSPVTCSKPPAAVAVRSVAFQSRRGPVWP